MALVAYSDESDTECDINSADLSNEDKVEDISAKKEEPNCANYLSSLNVIHGPIDPTQSSVVDKNDSSNIKEKIASVKTTTNESKKLKIVLPALSEYKCMDDDDQSIPQQKESLVGTGLFSLLPDPKHMKTTNLIPQCVQKIADKKQAKDKECKKSESRNDNGEESDDASDFFSLNKVEEENLATDKINVKTDRICSAPKPDPLHVIPVTPIVGCEHIDYVKPLKTIPTTLDESVIVRLAGKRNQSEDINFVDIKADDTISGRNEWLKSVSEEQPTTISKKGNFNPTQRRRHQITYLAHQARSRELELKNVWASNKVSKLQSRSKYGF